MRKLFFIVALLLGCLLSLGRAQEMRTLFLNAPDDVFPLLTRNMRADLVDYIDAGMVAKVTNLLSGESRLDTLTSDFLYLSSTASSSVQMKLLPVDGGALLCVVNSVKAEAEDSRVAFYSTDWERLDAASYFTVPAIKDFFVQSDTIDHYVDMCDIYLVSLGLCSSGNTMVAEYTMPRYMSTSDSAAVAPLLRKLYYVWAAGRFVQE